MAKQLPYRAIALDLDGTLTNHDKVVTPKTREALLQAKAEGAVIILASGRPTYGIEPVAECQDWRKNSSPSSCQMVWLRHWSILEKQQKRSITDILNEVVLHSLMKIYCKCKRSSTSSDDEVLLRLLS